MDSKPELSPFEKFKELAGKVVSASKKDVDELERKRVKREERKATT